jgi:hypothetical protein
MPYVTPISNKKPLQLSMQGLPVKKPAVEKGYEP